MVGGEFGQLLRNIVGMGLRHVGGTEPVQGAQDPQVGEIVLTPGEAEQAEPVADRERVEVERISLVIGDRHRDEPLPVHMAVGAYVSHDGTRRDAGCGCRDTPLYSCSPATPYPIKTLIG